MYSHPAAYNHSEFLQNLLVDSDILGFPGCSECESQQRWLSSYIKLVLMLAEAALHL